MAGKLLAAVLCLALLCSCAPISMNTEELLVAPRLNQRQAAVEDALRATLEPGNIVYKYPQRGEYRSPFVFFDLDSDGFQEAIIFYTYSGEDMNVRAKILQEDGRGNWASLHDISGSGDQIDFIEFANLLSPDEKCLVIGWQNSRRGSSDLGVYSYRGGRFSREILQNYQSYNIGEYLGGPLSEIAVIFQDNSDYYQLSLFGKTSNGQLDSLGGIALSPDINSILQMTWGRLWDYSRAIYVDELRTDTAVATEIIQITQNGPVMLVGENVDFENYSATFRTEEILCADLRSEGTVSIPTLTELPEFYQEDELTPVLLTDYIRLTPGGFDIAYSLVRNEDAGYLVFFPNSWLGTVTVVRRPESNEWRFYKVDPDGDGILSELLRIQVYSVRNYRDQFTDDYFLLAERGLFQYYACIPPTTGEPLAVTEAQVREMFRLL